jgi:hypothetical protein
MPQWGICPTQEMLAEQSQWTARTAIRCCPRIVQDLDHPSLELPLIWPNLPIAASKIFRLCALTSYARYRWIQRSILCNCASLCRIRFEALGRKNAHLRLLTENNYIPLLSIARPILLEGSAAPFSIFGRCLWYKRQFSIGLSDRFRNPLAYLIVEKSFAL